MAEEAEGVAVELVRAGFRDDVDDATESVAEFGRVRVAVDLKFLGRFLADGRTDATAGIVEVLQAIDEEAIATTVRAAEREARVGSLDRAIGRIVYEEGSFDDAGGEESEVEIVAAIDRKIIDAHLLDRVGLLGALDFNRGDVRDHDDFRFNRRNGDLDQQ